MRACVSGRHQVTDAAQPAPTIVARSVSAPPRHDPPVVRGGGFGGIGEFVGPIIIASCANSSLFCVSVCE